MAIKRKERRKSVERKKRTTQGILFAITTMLSMDILSDGRMTERKR